jgi:hypothetical protein
VRATLPIMTIVWALVTAAFVVYFVVVALRTRDRGGS